MESHEATLPKALLEQRESIVVMCEVVKERSGRGGDS